MNGGVENGLHVASNQLACTATTTCTAWRSNAQYGPDVELWTRVTALVGTNNHIRLYGRLRTPGSAAYDAYLLRTNQLAGTDEVYLERIDNGAHTRLATVNRELAVGDVLLLRVKGSTVEGWLNSGSSWTRLATAQDSTYPSAGFVGIGLRGTTGRLDDFGGRTMGAPPAPTITTTTSPDATTGQAYSQTLAASGGTPPYSQWSTVSGSLPPGLTLTASTGAIRGTATTRGGYSFTVQVTDSATRRTQGLTIDVRDPLQVTTASTPAGTVGQAYSQAVSRRVGRRRTPGR